MEPRLYRGRRLDNLEWVYGWLIINEDGSIINDDSWD